MAVSSAAFKDFRSSGVVVFANSKTERSKLPKGAMEVRKSAGNIIPMVFVTSADGTKGVKAFSYDTLKKGTRDANRELRSLLKEDPNLFDSGNSPSDTEDPDSGEKTTGSGSPNLLAASQEWTNAEGTAITAAIQKVQDGNVHFLMPNGKVIPYPLTKLSADSQSKIKRLTEKK